MPCVRGEEYSQWQMDEHNGRCSLHGSRADMKECEHSRHKSSGRPMLEQSPAQSKEGKERKCQERHTVVTGKRCSAGRHIALSVGPFHLEGAEHRLQENVRDVQCSFPEGRGPYPVE